MKQCPDCGSVQSGQQQLPNHSNSQNAHNNTRLHTMSCAHSHTKTLCKQIITHISHAVSHMRTSCIQTIEGLLKDNAIHTQLQAERYSRRATELKHAFITNTINSTKMGMHAAAAITRKRKQAGRAHTKAVRACKYKTHHHAVSSARTLPSPTKSYMHILCKCLYQSGRASHLQRGVQTTNACLQFECHQLKLRALI